MLSDMLTDAVRATRRYQRRMPELYDGLEEPINTVVAVMESLSILLDSALQGIDGDAPFAGAIWTDLEALDIERLQTACAELKSHCALTRLDRKLQSQ